MKPKDESVTTQGHESARKGESLFDFVRWLASVILLVLVVRTFLYEPFNIPSGSMIPTLQVGDYLWVSKYSYGYSKYSFPLSPNLFQGRVWGAEPHRGDVAVFRFTKNPSIDYVKRIVGLPGDHIQMRAGQLYLNGTAVPCAPQGEYAEQDEYHTGRTGHLCHETLPGSAGRPPVEHEVLLFPEDGQRNDTPDYIVPPGYFFAMGDNRDHSADSRFMGDADQDLGFVPMENLVGRAGMIFFSVDMTHPIWQFWAWPTEIRWARLFHVVH